MADIRKNIECGYCGAHFHIKYADDVTAPIFCPFCAETFVKLEDEEDDGDLDYTDDERGETEDFN